MKIVIILPAFNEEKNIGKVIRDIIDEGYEDIFVVDDGSTDDTARISMESGARVITHLINRGAGAAIATGLEASKQIGADIAVILDADGQHLASEIKSLVAPIAEGRADAAIGRRVFCRSSMPIIKRIFNTVANIITYAVSGFWSNDSQSGFRAFSKNSMKLLQIKSSGYEFCSEISREIMRNKFRTAEVPVTTIYNSRTKGNNLTIGLETAVKLMARSLMR